MSTAMPVLETERLIIRPFVMEDLDNWHQIIDIDINMEAKTLEGRKRWLQWCVLNYEELADLFQPPYGDRAVIQKQLGRLVGSVGYVPGLFPFGLLHYYHSSVDPERISQNIPEVGLYYALARDCWGLGFATEACKALIEYAFTTLNLRRILAWTDYENLRSQKVMERLGMQIERNPRPEPEWLQVVGILENRE